MREGGLGGLRGVGGGGGGWLARVRGLRRGWRERWVGN